MKYKVTMPLSLIKLALKQESTSFIKGVGLYLMMKSWFGDSRFHDFTLQKLQEKFHLKYSTAFEAVQSAMKYKLVEIVKYTDKNGNKHKDLLATRCQKYGKGKLVHFSVIRSDDHSKAFIYLDSNRRDNSKDFNQNTIQHMSDIVDLLCLSSILSIMEARQRLTDSETKELTSKRGRRPVNLNRMSFKECRRLENRLKRNLKVGEITPLNSGLSLEGIIRLLHSPFIKLRRVRRLVKMLVDMKLVYRKKNIIVAHDYNSDEESFDYTNIATDKPQERPKTKTKGLNAIEVFMQAHGDSSSIVKAYQLYKDSMGVVYDDYGNIDKRETHRLYRGKKGAKGKYYKRLADSFYIQCDIFRTKGKSQTMYNKAKQLNRSRRHARNTSMTINTSCYDLPY